MKMLSVAAIVVAVIALVMTGMQTVDMSKPAKNGYHQQKVVYHINDIQKAKGALRNVKNHLNALGDKNADIIVVTHSSGAFALVDGSMGKTDKDGKPIDLRDQIAALANRGVKFEICANTIRGKKIPKDKINEYATVVPSGVAEIASLEQKGYLYVKP
jgi:intracellular sulfur oxidation DsrE/DsrF family protein